MELEQWKDDKEHVKMKKRQFAWKKPMRGKLEVPLPKMVVAEGTAGDELDIRDVQSWAPTPMTPSPMGCHLKCSLHN